VKGGIKRGEPLLSWGLPFGYATRDILPGEYVCNASVLVSLHERKLDFELPQEPNFEDRLESLKLGSEWVPGQPLEKVKDSKLTFKGFPREGTRGVGTRNFIVILGLTSRTGSFARILEQTLRTKVDLKKYPNIDGIVSVSHTEGGTELTPLNNLSFVLRALSGFVVHPNIGAVLVIDDTVGDELPDSEKGTLLKKQTLLNFMKTNNYPVSEVPLEFLTIAKNFTSELSEGVKLVQGWLEKVNQNQRVDVPLKHLKIALQCGGSDAFSGVSANPLIGWVAMNLIKHGGTANLAETDELMGAEPYIIKMAKDLPTAKKFLDTVEWYKTYAGNHGHSAEGNPSGGNKFRGLYNIALKSLGAAMKKNPQVTLDHVIDYAERMTEPGYHFMNSPGNDLESIAGQVASGANVIFFTTGNGSITNFPFVPTLKVVTTTNRFNMLAKDMDVNAGKYIDGIPMEELGQSLFDHMLQIASGKKSVGERAGHSQISIWRNWAFNDNSKLNELSQRPELLPGESLFASKTNGTPDQFSNLTFKGIQTEDGKLVSDQIGLVLPTSICSGQIARLISDKLNFILNQKSSSANLAEKLGVSRFVALPHTEGCGSSSGYGEALYRRTLLGHLINPLVKHGLLLEHGCEKTHNDYMSLYLRSYGVDTNRFGWASVQMDGGIDQVTEKVLKWFEDKMASAKPTQIDDAGIGHLRVAFVNPAKNNVSIPLAKALGTVVGSIAKANGYVVVSQNSGVLTNVVFLQTLDSSTPINIPVTPSIAYGQAPKEAHGFHVMQTMTDHWVENLTGLGATGVELIVSLTDQTENSAQKPHQTHPEIPVLQISTKLPASFAAGDPAEFLQDFDLVLGDDAEKWAVEIFALVLKAASREYTPKLALNADFQIARDLLSVSM
jgi:altronate dehydratase